MTKFIAHLINLQGQHVKMCRFEAQNWVEASEFAGKLAQGHDPELRVAAIAVNGTAAEKWMRLGEPV